MVRSRPVWIYFSIQFFHMRSSSWACFLVNRSGYSSNKRESLLSWPSFHATIIYGHEIKHHVTIMAGVVATFDVLSHALYARAVNTSLMLEVLVSANGMCIMSIGVTTYF